MIIHVPLFRHIRCLIMLSCNSFFTISHTDGRKYYNYKLLLEYYFISPISIPSSSNTCTVLHPSPTTHPPPPPQHSTLNPPHSTLHTPSPAGSLNCQNTVKIHIIFTSTNTGTQQVALYSVDNIPLLHTKFLYSTVPVSCMFGKTCVQVQV